ncbi:hypothetical protein [Glycomyces sp. YM15]|uniref:hypothetical protein n=1 Tax=Glycomyces sp. YM15 TaxID=2800446 RepID=UPI0019630E8A|nr:hypothetical protein [Glycomyces sp. YM15]
MAEPYLSDGQSLCQRRSANFTATVAAFVTDRWRSGVHLLDLPLVNGQHQDIISDATRAAMPCCRMCAC